jgi:hypothetical protein
VVLQELQVLQEQQEIVELVLQLELQDLQDLQVQTVPPALQEIAKHQVPQVHLVQTDQQV